MMVTAIIVAAGVGQRMKKEIPKQYLGIINKPLLFYTLDKIALCPKIDEIIVVVSEDRISYCQKEIVEKYKISKVKEIVKGGKERQDSVYLGLKKVSPSTELVLIHDGVRPLITNVLLEEVILRTMDEDAVVVGKLIRDTMVLKGKSYYIEKTLERKNVYTLETPQCFKYDLIKQAYQKAYQDNFYGTDDTSLVVRIGKKVAIIENNQVNIKVTYPQDLLLVEYLLLRDKI
ncbi:2-C-methyl-D-erythritol 4-phosphate cytidylyltransferase [bacterium]|nr:2-C-methyl-D-erythritol 4-phosphate cytidylyltransferase [bacterium]